MEGQSCYVYKQPHQLSRKKRGVENDCLDASLHRRRQLYQEHWKTQEQRIDETVRKANESIVANVNSFIRNRHGRDDARKLPVGILASGPGSTSNDALFQQVQESYISDDSYGLGLLPASSCPNLKTLLRNLIHDVTQGFKGGICDGTLEDGPLPKLLNYDLQILHNWCKYHHTKRVVVVFPESDGLSIAMLSDLLCLFNSWKDRISFVVIFSVATSVEIFWNRLPQAVSRTLSARVFATFRVQDILERVFEQTVAGPQVPVHLGPSLCDVLLQRQTDHFPSIDFFKRSLQYAYINHYYGNALSVLLDEHVICDSVSSDHFDALRNLPSFQRYTESLVEDRQPAKARELLESNPALLSEYRNLMQASRERLEWTIGAISAVHQTALAVGHQPVLPKSELYIKAASRDFAASLYMRELLLRVRTASAETLTHLVPSIMDIVFAMPAETVDISPDDFRDIHEQLLDYTDKQAHDERSPAEVEKSLEATPPKSRRSSRSKRGQPEATKIRRNDQVFKLVSSFHDLLASYFHKSFFRVQDLFPHEIFFYDLKAPHRDVFMPRPRFSIERALSSPHDYLGCKCCTNTADSLSGTQPPTAILYQLYLESGSLINAFDLWSAFQAVVKDQYEDEAVTMALFFRGLAELKSMGFIKPSRRKVDHLTKLAWRGL